MTLQLFCRRGESQAKNANHFGGCGESTSFTTKEQREAAELLLSWQAKSAGGEQPVSAARAARGCEAISIMASEEQRRQIS